MPDARRRGARRARRRRLRPQRRRAAVASSSALVDRGELRVDVAERVPLAELPAVHAAGRRRRRCPARSSSSRPPPDVPNGTRRCSVCLTACLIQTPAIALAIMPAAALVGRGAELERVRALLETAVRCSSAGWRGSASPRCSTRPRRSPETAACRAPQDRRGPVGGAPAVRGPPCAAPPGPRARRRAPGPAARRAPQRVRDVRRRGAGSVPHRARRARAPERGREPRPARAPGGRRALARRRDRRRPRVRRAPPR